MSKQRAIERRTASYNKVDMHVKLNKAYADLMHLAALLDVPIFNKGLINGRTFLSSIVDNSDYPEV